MQTQSSKLPFATFGYDGPGRPPKLVRVLSARWPRATKEFFKDQQTYGVMNVFMARKGPNDEAIPPRHWDMRAPESSLKREVLEELVRMGKDKTAKPGDVIQAMSVVALRRDQLRVTKKPSPAPLTTTGRIHATR